MMNYRTSIIVLIILSAICVLSGCNSEQDGGDITSSNPTIEERESIKTKDEAIEDAIAACEKVRMKVEELDEIDDAMVYINHESVLVAVRLYENSNEISEELRGKIFESVTNEYDKAKTIAISNDMEVYQSISRLVRDFKENNNWKLFVLDMKEIIENITMKKSQKGTD